MRLKWLISWLIVNFFFRIFLGLKVEGVKKIPQKRGVIICPNHISSWDPPLVGAAIPREVHFLAKEDLFKVNKIFSWLIRAYNALPIKRETGGHGTLRIAMDLLRENKLLVVFPEGTRNKTDEPLLPLKPGAALLSMKTGAPIVPAYILGSKASPIGWMMRKTPLCIRFDTPLEPSNYPEGKEGIIKMTEDLRNVLLELRTKMKRRIEKNKKSGKKDAITVI